MNNDQRSQESWLPVSANSRQTLPFGRFPILRLWVATLCASLLVIAVSSAALDQTIIGFGPFANVDYTQTKAYNFYQPSSSSGLPVTVRVASGPANLTVYTNYTPAICYLDFTGIGTVVLEAAQAGNAQYNPMRVTRNIVVANEPPDTDGDGLSDGAEINTYKTDPFKADTDGDGLTDPAEINMHHTDPLKSDTDGDGLTDGVEVNTYGTAPLKTDTDGDGLSDPAEINTHYTDPLKSDTDGDGLSDYVEINTCGTDPLKADTDGDGLTDSSEINTHHTDPLKADTDGDGLSDSAELPALN